MWSVTGYDWSAKSAAEIVGKVNRQVGSDPRARGEIVLLHDGGHLAFGTDRGYTVEATRLLMQRYSARKFVSASAYSGNLKEL
jgi:hypothetical protein